MKKEPEKCAVCGGKIIRKQIRHDQHWGDEIVIFEDVPAKVCLDCGEVWFESHIVEAMDRILKEKKRPQKQIQVPVWSLADTVVPRVNAVAGMTASGSEVPLLRKC